MRGDAAKPRQRHNAARLAAGFLCAAACTLIATQNAVVSRGSLSGISSVESPTRRLLVAAPDDAASASAHAQHVQREATEQQAAFCRGLASLDYPAPNIEVAWAAPTTAAAPASHSASSSGRVADGTPGVVAKAAAMRRRLHGRRSLQQQAEQKGDAAGLRRAAWEHLVRGRHELRAAEEQQHEWSSGGSGSSSTSSSSLASYERFSQWVSSLRGDDSAYTSDGGHYPGVDDWRMSEMGEDLWRPKEKKKDRTRISLKEGIKASFSFGSVPPYSMYHFSENDIVSGFIQTKASWEGGESALMAEKLELLAQSAGLPRESLYFMDVGANIGAHSLVMAAAGFSVIAFEPLRVNEQTLRHSLCANPGLAPRFTLLPRGLGNATLSCAIYSIDSNQGDGTVNCDPNAKMTEGFQKRQDLDIVTLDGYLADWMPALRGRVGVVKIDVEGSELSVVQGGKHFFKTVRPRYVMAECADGMMQLATGTLARDFFRQMAALGYSVHRGTFDGEVILPSAFSNFTEPGIVNYWFVAQETG